MIQAIGRRRLVTLSVEILVGIAVVIAILLYAIYGPLPWMPQRKWIILAILSTAIFGVPAWWYRRYWARTRFWLAYAVLLCLHLIGYCILLLQVKEFPPLLGPLSITLESLLIFPVLSVAARANNHGQRG